MDHMKHGNDFRKLALNNYVIEQNLTVMIYVIDM